VDRINGHAVRVTGDTPIVNHQLDDVLTMTIRCKGWCDAGPVYQAGNTACRSLGYTPLVGQLITIRIRTGRAVQLQFVIQNTGTVRPRIGHWFHIAYDQLDSVRLAVVFAIIND